MTVSIARILAAAALAAAPGAGGNTGSDFVAKAPAHGYTIVVGTVGTRSTPEELAAYQRSEIAKWAKVVRESGAKVE